MSNSDFPRWIDLPKDWAFAYGTVTGDDAAPPLWAPEQARAVMPLPGFWDDHLDQLRAAGFSKALRFNPEHEPIRLPMTGSAPDASLPHLVGIGQYDCQVTTPRTGRVTFECGPTFLEAWLWINGKCVAHQPHYSTGWSVPLDEFLEPGGTNRLSLQVSNQRPRSKGCITRGFKGYSAGVAGPARLRVTGAGRIVDCHVQPIDGRAGLRWSVPIDQVNEASAMLAWRLVAIDTGAVVQAGTRAVTHGANTWETEAGDVQPWSDRSPTLYRIELSLHVDGELSDRHEQTFGLRTITAEGFGLRLNGEPIYLRGATEHAYFAETCTVPLDKRVHRRHIAELKRLGFNWLRFHTWVPPEPYLDAADELGMLIQVEPPLGADDAEWADILRACRRHPSVIIYCGGNEELLDEAKLDQLERWATLRRELAPEAMFNPQEALRGIEYGWNDSDLGDDAVAEPYLHNPRRLERLKTFSDCFGQFSWGYLSYQSKAGDAAVIDDRLAVYQRPCLAHELGIHGSYVDLDLEHRYHGTRIGPEMYAAARAHLRDRGLEHRAADYYVNSCAWMRRLRKHAVETARRCQRVAGYDLLGAIDHHWHRTIYPCGVMNEFYELKPGETAEDVRRYNGASVLLLDHGHRWTCTADQQWTATLAASIYEHAEIKAGRVEWCLRDDQGHVYRRGGWNVASLPNGQVSTLGTITFNVPERETPAACTLDVRLTSDSLQIDNQWPLWVYPAAAPIPSTVDFAGALADRWSVLPRSTTASPGAGEQLHVTAELNEATVRQLERGGRVLLLGVRPFPSQAMTYQIACAGRATGNIATCIHDHPITVRWPAAAFCDWDFQPMMDRGRAVRFDAVDLPFEPIVEVASSFKDARKQAALFELRVGQGRLLVCSLGLRPDDPAAVWVLKTCIDYACSTDFAPHHGTTPAALQQLLANADGGAERLDETDQGYDERAALTRE